MKFRKSLWVALAATAAAFQAQACYTVYDGSGRVTWRSTQAPVDMSLPLHDTLPQRFPGGHMVFDSTDACQAVVPAAPRRGVTAGPAPLLTDRAAARETGVPFAATAAHDIVMVQPRDAAAVLAASAPLTVVPAAVPASMLAGAPVPPDTSRMGGPPARSTVITELRDPQVTIVERREVTRNRRQR